MAYPIRQLIEYFGSRTATIGFLLFWLGLGATVLSAFTVAMSVGGSADPLPAILIVVPAWGIVAVSLGFFLRRGNRAMGWVAIACVWLLIGAFFVFLIQNGVDPFVSVGLPSPFHGSDWK